MIVKSVKVSNLRGILETEELDLFNFTSLVGPNNSSKSTIARALSLALGVEKPNINEWHKEDYDKDIIIEVLFDKVEDWERNKPGVSSLVYKNQIKLRYIASAEEKENGEKKANIRYEAYLPEEQISGWNDGSWSNLSEEIKDIAKGIGFTSGNHIKSQANKEKLKQEIRDKKESLVQLSAPRWSSDGISINQALQQALPQVVLIPAVSDVTDETKSTEKNTYGILLRKALIPAIKATSAYGQIDTSIKEIIEMIQPGSGQQLDSVKQLNEQISSNIKPLLNAEAEVTLDEPDFEKVFGPSFGIKLRDDVLTDVNLQGNGLQRALIFSLLEVLANSKSSVEIPSEDGTTSNIKTKTTLLLFEEPELFIHPHLMRKLKEVLIRISNKSEWQVVITTHSPFLINVTENPKSLLIFSKEPGLPPKIKQLKSDPFEGSKQLKIEKERLRATVDFHPTVCEAFFARRVILVEGATEIAVLKNHPELYKLCSISETSLRDCSIISCGGKWTIISMARLLLAFGIPLKIVHDMDKKGRTSDELSATRAIDPYHVNEKLLQLLGDNDKLFVCEDTFEDLIWTGKKYTNKDKPFRAWKRIEDICSIQNELDKFPNLKALVSFVYN
ncbi:AAA family ATPase [Leptospira adleri]|uniref:Uncharacterized protein n=1 Tax=Leptospira adleri TaxID=2023186 RepID=A0A2M9YI64_9LEPT|nr:AAA family ATPase [Leptospira adleri]PJZ51217.1 hypothetical protein CH380_21220 [Leptospira adleri]PJZ59656.1 hypothetical protein CH376_22590 [Leptospira adleri]